MRWLLRFFWFISRSLVTFLVWIVVNAIRRLLPVLMVVLRFLIGYVSTSLSAMIYGPRRYVDGLASKWTLQLLDRGVSQDYIDELHDLCIFLAALKFVIGLVIAGVVLVAILRTVYNIWI